MFHCLSGVPIINKFLSLLNTLEVDIILVLTGNRYQYVFKPYRPVLETPEAHRAVI